MAYKKEEKIEMVEINLRNIEVGDVKKIQHKISQDDVNRFVALTGDFNPLHVDKEFATKTTFRKPVVHGMLTSSFISTMIGTKIPGKGALWASQTLDFLQPAYIGDKITVTATVKQKSISTRSIILDIVITNQNGNELVKGESRVKMLKSQEGGSLKKNRIKKNEKVNVTDAGYKRVGAKSEVKVRQSKKEDNIEKKSEKFGVLVTGGGTGIGAEVAIKLAKDGFPVILGYYSSKKSAREVANQIEDYGGKVIALRGDVSNIKDVKDMVTRGNKTFGFIGGIVHCAASSAIPNTFNNTSWDIFQKQIDIQIKGAHNCVNALIPQMIEEKRGSIVFIGSIFADGRPPVQQSAYVVTKAAIEAFARALSVEYGVHGVRVNTIAPGMTETDMIANLPERVKLLATMETPLRRLAKPIDIANAVSFLIGDDSSHITGEVIRVCGGVSM
tara:strand:+ start:189 stop:1520 length:1332 start_codon:yes stop_codon:yes gene_type:complete